MSNNSPKIRVAVVEDEMINSEALCDMLEELGYDIFGQYMRAETAWEAFEEEQPDFALLDIRLKGENDGIWLAGRIKERFSFPYIFLTSYGDKNTIESAAKTNPFGYLMKPIEKQNLHGAMEVALVKHGELQEKDPENPLHGSIFIKDESFYQKINLEEILYLKSDDNYLELFLKNRKHLVRGTLKAFQPKLPKDLFVQVHRSYVINLKAVEAFGANFVTVDGSKIPVSKSFQDKLKAHFKVY